jgi:hypothetical protein
MQEGDRCPKCGGALSVQTAVEVGHIFKLGTYYSVPFGATYLDEDGRERPLVMGSYGIGPARTIAAIVEQRSDEHGIAWPESVAPFDVHVVALPSGFDPADLADGFEQWLGRAETYLGYRVRLEIERANDRQEAFVRVREVLARFEDSPERQDAIRYAADKLDLPKETQAGLAPRAAASATGNISPRLLDAGQRLERNALAGVAAHRSLVPILAELGPEHFDADEHRQLRDRLVAGGELDPELDARAAAEGIDDRTAEELLLRLRERRIRRDLADADPTRTLELQATLARILQAVEQLASAQPLSR